MKKPLFVVRTDYNKNGFYDDYVIDGRDHTFDCALNDFKNAKATGRPISLIVYPLYDFIYKADSVNNLIYGVIETDDDINAIPDYIYGAYLYRNGGVVRYYAAPSLTYNVDDAIDLITRAIKDHPDYVG